MTAKSVIQSVIQPAITPVTSKFTSAIDFIRANAIINLNETGIVGSAPVTAWLNSGTGGSAFDLDVVLGTGANLTRIVQGGHDAVNASGSAGLETTSGQLITAPMTIYMIAKANALPAFNQFFTAARSQSTQSPFIKTNAAGNFQFNAGATITAGSADTSLHLHTLRYNADATTKYTVSGIGSVTGNAGAENYDFSSLFASHSAAETLDGAISQYMIIPFALTDPESDDIDAYLLSKFGL